MSPFRLDKVKAVVLDPSKQVRGTVQPKNGYLHIVLSCYDLAGKRHRPWIATGLPVKGNRRKAEALIPEAIAAYTRKCQEKVAPPPSMDFDEGDRSFAAFAAAWLLSRQADRSLERSTWENYENVVLNHLVPYFRHKGLEVDEVAPKHIRDYFTYKSCAGRLDGKEGGLSYPTLKKHHSVLKLILDEAVILEEARRNPALAVKPKKSVEQEDDDFREATFLDIKGANTVIAAFRGDLLEDIVILCLYYGLRRSEVLGLRWSAVDFDANTFSVVHTVVKHKTTVAKDRTKNGSSRATYELLPNVREILHKIKQRQNVYRRQFGPEYIASDYVFTWPNGKLLLPDYLTHHFQDVLFKQGLDPMRFHDLRHSCASILYEKGWNVKDIQEWMRHANVQTTMNIYTHLGKERKRILTKDLEDTFHVISSRKDHADLTA